MNIELFTKNFLMLIAVIFVVTLFGQRMSDACPPKVCPQCQVCTSSPTTSSPTTSTPSISPTYLRSTNLTG